MAKMSVENQKTKILNIHIMVQIVSKFAASLGTRQLSRFGYSETCSLPRTRSLQPSSSSCFVCIVEAKTAVSLPFEGICVTGDLPSVW